MSKEGFYPRREVRLCLLRDAVFFYIQADPGINVRPDFSVRSWLLNKLVNTYYECKCECKCIVVLLQSCSLFPAC